MRLVSLVNTQLPVIPKLTRIEGRGNVCGIRMSETFLPMSETFYPWVFIGSIRKASFSIWMIYYVIGGDARVVDIGRKVPASTSCGLSRSSLIISSTVIGIRGGKGGVLCNWSSPSTSTALLVSSGQNFPAMLFLNIVVYIFYRGDFCFWF